MNLPMDKSPYDIIVKFFTKRAEEGKLDQSLMSIANHYMKVMKDKSEEVLVEPDWRIRPDFPACQGQGVCTDCLNVKSFMIRQNVSEAIKVALKHGSITSQKNSASWVILDQKPRKLEVLSIWRLQRSLRHSTEKISRIRNWLDKTL
jgi:hypothetical protein